MNESYKFILFRLTIVILGLHPWILFGLRGPEADAVNYLLSAAYLYFGIPVSLFEQQLFQGPMPFLAPLLVLTKGPWFFWGVSIILAAISSALLCWLHSELRRFFACKRVADAVAIALAVHPFLQQMHYWWMTEWLYVECLLLGVLLACRALEGDTLRKYAQAGMLLGVAAVMRTQAIVTIGLLGLMSVVIRYRKSSSRRELAVAVALLCLGPVVLMSPLAVLKFFRCGTFSLNQTAGLNTHDIVRVLHWYDPANGPESMRLYQNAKRILADPKRELPGLAISTDAPITLVAAREIVALESHTGREVLMVLAVYTNDPGEANRQIKAIFFEALSKHRLEYVMHSVKAFAWYFLSPSENPNEWFSMFVRGEPQRQPRPWTLGGLKATERFVGGLVHDENSPFLRAYSKSRSAFIVGMTWAKRLYLLIAPLLLVFLGVQIRKRQHPLDERTLYQIRVLLVCLATHVLTVAFLALNVGFSHRYGIPFDPIVILTLALALDHAISHYPQRNVRRGLANQAESLPR